MCSAIQQVLFHHGQWQECGGLVVRVADDSNHSIQISLLVDFCVVLRAKFVKQSTAAETRVQFCKQYPEFDPTSNRI
jgi:hypothetical protein